MKKEFLFLFATFITFSSFSQPGALDSSFGKKGMALAEFGNLIDHGIPAMAMQPDEKILFVATHNYGGSDKEDTDNINIMLVRFTKNGELDSSFGDEGSVITQFNKYTYGKAVGLQHDGKIIVAATINRGDYGDYGIIRFNKNGSIDKSFGKDGWVRMDVGGGWDNVFTMAIQPDDKIVMAGKSILDSSNYYSMVRFTADGHPDKSFGNNGVVMNRSANFFYRDCLALQPDGKIILASAVSIGDYYHPKYGLALLRFLNNGFPDKSFGHGGRMFVELGGGSLDEPMVAIALRKDGKIAASASVGTGDTSRFCVLRFNKDGTTDKMFGTNGRVVTKVVTEKSRANNIFVQPDNKIIIVGL